MNFHKRYLNRETISVYNEIEKLNYNSLSTKEKETINKVLIETFERVYFNLNVIYTELLNINYLFKKEFKFNFEKPIHSPLENTDLLLEKLNIAV